MCCVTTPVVFSSTTSFGPAGGAGRVGLGGYLTSRPPPPEVIIFVASAVIVAAGSPHSALVEVGGPDGGVVGDGVGAGEGGSAAVDTASITLSIAASHPPFDPAAFPLPLLAPQHGPND